MDYNHGRRNSIDFDGDDLSQLPDPNTTKILIGQSSWTNSIVMMKYLEKLGYNLVVRVESGGKAVELAEKEIFDIIFLDLVQLAALPGTEATKLIRQHELEKKLPPSSIVGLTAIFTGKEPKIAQDCGMNGILVIPMHITDLKDALCKYGHHKAIRSLKDLTMMYITNQPQLFQYNAQNKDSVVFRNKKVSLSSDILSELCEMRENYPSFYKYPNFDGMDDSEILCIVSNDYYVLKEGVEQAIKAYDIKSVHRSARAMAAILKFVSSPAELAATELSKCKDCDQAQQFLQTLELHMAHVWE